MNVSFFTLAKKPNSTKQPSGAGTSYDCKLIQPSGMLNPSITLDLGATSNPTAYNYAYISDFGRYYWIDEWTSNLGFWTARLSVDPLASWRSYLTSETRMVLRSASDSDGDLIDTLYPQKATPTIVRNTFTSPWAGSTWGAGTFVATVLSNNKTSYYAFTTYAGFQAFIAALFDVNLIQNIIGSATELQRSPWVKSVVNPIQFVPSIFWLPVAYPYGTAVSSIGIGIGGSVNVSSCVEITSPVWTMTAISAALHDHPQAATRGTWLNTANVVRSFYMPMFGDITLDPQLTAGSSTVQAQISLDMKTGTARLKIWPDATGQIITDVSASIGVSILYAQLGSTNVYEGATGIATGLIGSAIAAYMNPFGSSAGFAENLFGAKSGIAKLAMNRIYGTVTSAGATGSVAGFSGSPALTEIYYEITEDMDAERGRPLCKNKQIGLLSGYMQLADGDFEIPCTDSELRAIKTFTEGGFFYE